MSGDDRVLSATEEVVDQMDIGVTDPAELDVELHVLGAELAALERQLVELAPILTPPKSNSFVHFFFFVRSEMSSYLYLQLERESPKSLAATQSTGARMVENEIGGSIFTAQLLIILPHHA